MSRWHIKPNPENASLKELLLAAKVGGHETTRRCTAISLLINGVERDKVCASLIVSERSVRKWVRAFNKSGIDGLIAKKRSGAPKKISGRTAEDLVKHIEQPERENRTFWTAKAFHGFIKERYKIECCYETVVRFFREKGYVLKVPQPWPDRQDEQQREQFRQHLKTLALDPEIDLWFTDETGIEGEPKSRRRWALKGSKPRITKNGDHIRLTIMGMVLPRSGEFFAIEASHSDSVIFQAFLDEAAKMITPSRKRNILILDNASWHKKKSLNWHFFEPLYLPPYSPDLNPIENLWNTLKAEWFNNIYCKTHDELLARADQAILSLIDNPDKVAHVTHNNGTYL